MTQPRAYLDHNATSPLHPAAKEALWAAYGAALNPSSVHGEGRHARKLIEDAREQLAEAFACFPREIVFCGSATEANITLLRAYAGPVLVSAIEHASVLKAREDAVLIPVTADGMVDLAALDALLARHPGALVSVMVANNETGVIQPVREVADLVRRHDGARLHVDAVQAFGKLPVDVAGWGADYVTLSAHKSGGPVGAAAWIIRQGAPGITPLMTGGGQEFNQRAGTENVPAIAAWAALAALTGELLAHQERIRQWRDGFEREALALCPEARVIGQREARLANTTCITMPAVKGETQVIALDLAGVAVSSGSACTSGKVNRSHVLAAMGLDDETAACAIRLSAGWNTTETDYKNALAAWQKVYAKATANRAKNIHQHAA